MTYLNCPDCGLTVAVRGFEATIEDCPRCIARHGKAVRVSPGRPGELELREVSDGTRHTLTLLGEMDFLTAPALEARVVQLCATGACEIVLDLGGLSFIDSRGLMAILLSRKRCEGRGCGFSMTRGRSPVQRLFEVTGFLNELPFRRGAAQAGDDGPGGRDPTGVPELLPRPLEAEPEDGGP